MKARLEGGRVLGVRAMGGVVLNAHTELTADGALGRFGGVGRAHEVPPALDRILALRQLDKHYQAVPQTQNAKDFVRLALEELDVSTEVAPRELEYIPATGPAVITANHPFGGIEGLLFANIILSRRPDVRVLANVQLERIAELRELFISVDPFEGKRAARGNIQPLREAIRWVQNGGALLVFPSGEVSHFQFRRSRVTDPEWRPSVGSR